jgi:hypothetical protein
MRTVVVKANGSVAIMTIFDDEIAIPDEIQKTFGNSWTVWVQVDPATLPKKPRELDSLDIVNGQVVIDKDKLSLQPLEGTPAKVQTWRLHAILASQMPTLFDAINQAIPVNTAAWFAWHRAPEIPRDSPTMNGLAHQLGLTAHQVDQVYIDAANLPG